MKTVDIKGKPYVEVNERIKEFRNNSKYEGFSLESELIWLENGICTIKAIIKDKNGIIKATGLAQEKENSSFINKTSFIENCETSAWGRALGNLGIGIDTSIASADEIQNAVLNQENKKNNDKSKTNKEVAKEEPISNNDIDILMNISTFNDLENLTIFFNENKTKVEDFEAFRNACTQRRLWIEEQVQKKKGA